VDGDDNISVITDPVDEQDPPLQGLVDREMDTGPNKLVEKISTSIVVNTN
jgi:hypothetical protein